MSEYGPMCGGPSKKSFRVQGVTMATVLEPRRVGAEASERSVPEPAMYFRLDDATWDTYEAVLEAIGERPVYVTYDRGTLELMAPSFDHESPKMLFDRTITVMAREYEFKLVSSGSTTFKRKRDDQGFEPDQSYYLRSATKLPGGKLDVSKGPPPDLAIEIDIYSGSLDRLPLYQTWGVPEVWRYSREAIEILGLKKSGYRPLKESRAFPGVTAEFLVEAFGRYGGDEIAWMDEVRQLVRERIKLSASHGSGPKA
jgi:Uma2 family endonuclease